MITIRVDGVDQVIAKLDGVKGVRWARRPIEQSLKVLEATVKTYPPAIPGSRYVRTTTLGKRWLTAPVTVTSDTVRGRIGNNTEYAPFVQASRFQARVHRGRWVTDVRAVEINMPRIRAFFQRAIARALEGSR